MGKKQLWDVPKYPKNPKKDTLFGGSLDFLSWRGSAGHFLCTGELCQQLQVKILPALVLLATVDENLVLGGRRRKKGN